MGMLMLNCFSSSCIEQVVQLGSLYVFTTISMQQIHKKTHSMKKNNSNCPTHYAKTFLKLPWDLFVFHLFSLTSSALDHSATALPPHDVKMFQIQFLLCLFPMAYLRS